MTSTITLQQLCGLDESHLLESSQWSCKLHRDLIAPLDALRNAASMHGFELAIASAYRGYHRQKIIWDDKVRGVRPVLDDCGRAMDISSLDDWSKIQAILHWSALPGASRHHWGTEIDIYEKNAMPADYRLQLTVAECEQGGIFAEFYCWLDEQLNSQENFGFFRPYFYSSQANAPAVGVASEPWHLSYAPTAWQFQQLQTLEAVRDWVVRSDFLLQSVVLENLETIYNTYIRVDEAKYPAR